MKIRSNRTEKHGNGRKSRTPFHPLRYSKITALSAARFSLEDGMEEAEQLAAEIDVHMLSLLRSDGKQATAVAWMKRAYLLLERASSEIRKPKIYAIPGSYGVHTFVLTPPKQLVLPPAGLKPAPPIWFSGGKTVVYGDKYQNRSRAWTSKDTRRLVREREREKALKAAK